MRNLLRKFFPDRLVPTGPEVPTPLLDAIDGREAGTWLRGAMTTFGVNVASLMPGDFAAYARIPHGPPDDRREGALPRDLAAALVAHLAPATATGEECYFAVWAGFGIGQVIVHSPPGTSAEERRATYARMPRPPAWKNRPPTLLLPAREYHVFRGPIEGATTDLSGSTFGWQSANLWWPADHAWCVATEIDFAWTCVGASRACIDAVLADPRLAATEITSGSAPWLESQ